MFYAVKEWIFSSNIQRKDVKSDYQIRNTQKNE